MDKYNKFFVILVATVVVVISRGIAVSLIWNMFVPELFGLPTLPVLLAIALSSLLSVLIPNVATKRDSSASEKEQYIYLYGLLFTAILTPWIGYLTVLVATSLYY